MTAWEHWVLLALNFLLSLALISKEYSNLVCFLHIVQLFSLKFICCVKATKFCKTSTNYLSYVLPDKKLGEISQNFVAFSEYLNFDRDSFAIGFKKQRVIIDPRKNW